MNADRRAIDLALERLPRSRVALRAHRLFDHILGAVRFADAIARELELVEVREVLEQMTLEIDRLGSVYLGGLELQSTRRTRPNRAVSRRRIDGGGR